MEKLKTLLFVLIASLPYLCVIHWSEHFLYDLSALWQLVIGSILILWAMAIGAYIYKTYFIN